MPAFLGTVPVCRSLLNLASGRNEKEGDRYGTSDLVEDRPPHGEITSGRQVGPRPEGIRTLLMMRGCRYAEPPGIHSYLQNIHKQQFRVSAGAYI
jgi:hypothetical protein